MSTLRNLVVEDSPKECKTCEELLSLDSFYKDLKSKDGLSYSCKNCICVKGKVNRKNNPISEEQKEKRKERWKKWISNNKEKKEMDTNKWRKNNLKRYKDSLLLRKYGIDTDAYNKVLNDQSNSCAICKVHESNFDYPMFIDHCHITDKFRGLLCRNCNSGIGYFKDDVSVIKNSISYLNKFKENVNS